MTAHSLDQMRSPPRDVIARIGRRVGPNAKSLALVEETAALRRCTVYRNAFKGTAVSYPATFLGVDAIAAWMRRHRVTVDVTTGAQLNHALAAGIEPQRIVIHPANGAEATIRRAVDAGAARFVVSSSQQIAILAASAHRVLPVVLDATDNAVGGLAAEVLAHEAFDLIGLHCRLNPDDPVGALTLRGAVAEMAWIRRRRGVLLSRITLAGLDVGERCEPWIVRRVAEAIDEAIGDACARHRYPRPALTVAPTCAAPLPV
jgi:hypothetical protein